MHKKRRRTLPFVPTEDRAIRLKQMASLATALTSSRAEFSNELTYVHTMAPRSSNQARSEEGGIQVRKSFPQNNIITIWYFVLIMLLIFKVLNKEDKGTVELCKTMQQRGQCPPLLVVFDPCEGYFLDLMKLIYLHFGNIPLISNLCACHMN
jgi:hypothetical protein